MLVVGSNLTSTMKTIKKKWEFPHVKNLINTLPGPPEIRTASWCDTSTRIPGLDLNIPPFQGGTML